MSKIILQGNTQIRDLKEKIIKLESQWRDLYYEGRDNDGDFDNVKMDEISREIEWTEYLLWGARNGMRIN